MTLSPSPQPGPSPVMERHPDIARLVTTFYDRARADPWLGPVFDAFVTDWDSHLRALTAFWVAQIRGRGTYRGQPVAAHIAMAARIDPAMFDSWLTLWRDTARDVMETGDAEVLIAKATRIAEVLRRAVAEAQA